MVPRAQVGALGNDRVGADPDLNRSCRSRNVRRSMRCRRSPDAMGT
jgi:hypothetical protein